jgi:hypothetical protein
MSKKIHLAEKQGMKVVHQHLSLEYHFTLGGKGSSFCEVSAVGKITSFSPLLLVLGGLLRVVVSGSSCGRPAAAFFRASTTRRTMTAQRSVSSGIDLPLGRHTRKCLLNIHHLPCARLHEPKVVLPAPLQTISCSNLPNALQIAFVTSDNAHRQDLVLLHPILSFHVDHLCEVLECLERARLGDVINQEERVAFQVSLRPEAAVFLLSCGVCEAKRICRPVYRSCDGVGVFDRRVISMKGSC